MLLEQVACAPPSFTAIKVDGLGLDHSHAPVLASMLQRPALQELSAERNQLSEAGLLQLADALLAIEGGHARLTMLAVANQKGALSTLALTRLLDAMAMTPSLTLDYTHAFTA